MLFNSNSITVSFSCQQYQCNEIEIFENEDGEANEVVVEYSSTLATEAVLRQNDRTGKERVNAEKSRMGEQNRTPPQNCGGYFYTRLGIIPEKGGAGLWNLR